MVLLDVRLREGGKAASMRCSPLVGLEQWVGFSCLLKLHQKPEEQL